MTAEAGFPVSPHDPHHGRRSSAPAHVTLSHAEEIVENEARRPPEPDATAAEVAALLLSRAREQAEDLLSRAQMQAELLRVNAEAVRAEAECLRAEAAALRTVVRDEVEIARSHVEAATQRRTEAEEVQRALRAEAEAARVEFESTRTEAISIRRLLHAEIDAGLADAQQMRSEVQRLWAETDKLAAELRLLCARVAGTTSGLDEGAVDGAPDTPAGTGEEPAPHHPVPDARPSTGANPELERNVAELLNEIWDAVSEELSPRLGERLSRPPAAGAAAQAPPSVEPPGAEEPIDRTRASQPLIGSGGWRAAEPKAPDGEPSGQAEPAPPPPPALGRRRRRFHSK